MGAVLYYLIKRVESCNATLEREQHTHGLFASSNNVFFFLRGTKREDVITQTPHWTPAYTGTNIKDLHIRRGGFTLRHKSRDASLNEVITLQKRDSYRCSSLNPIGARRDNAQRLTNFRGVSTGGVQTQAGFFEGFLRARWACVLR